MKQIKLGLIPSPDLPAKITQKIAEDFPDFLQKHVDLSASWQAETVINPLVGAAEYMNQLIEKAIHLKLEKNWDFVICLTDLPHFMDERVVVAEINHNNHVALISIPAFGIFPVKQRLKWSISQILNDMVNKSEAQRQQQKLKAPLNASKMQLLLTRITPIHKITLHDTSKKSKCDNKKQFNSNQKVKETNTEESEDRKDEKTQEDTREKSDIRYYIHSKIIGLLRILSGMSLANRPWTALMSFKKILMIAFGTGIYITLFPTPWDLSTIYSIPRFIILMISAILAWLHGFSLLITYGKSQPVKVMLE